MSSRANYREAMQEGVSRPSLFLFARVWGCRAALARLVPPRLQRGHDARAPLGRELPLLATRFRRLCRAVGSRLPALPLGPARALGGGHLGARRGGKAPPAPTAGLRCAGR